LVGGSGHDAIDGGAGTDKLIVNLDLSSFDGGIAYGINGNPLFNTSSYTTIQTALPGAATSYTVYLGDLDSTTTSSVEHYQMDLTGTVNPDLLIWQNGTRMWGGAGTDTFYADWSSSTSAIVWLNDPGTTQNVAALGKTISTKGLERLLIGTGSGNDELGNMVTSTTDDQFFTGAGNDTILAGGGNDWIEAGADSDSIDGGDGADSMYGGAGNDSYYVQNSGDTVVEASDGGTDTVYSTLSSYTLGANAENGRIRTTSAANLSGNALNNVLGAGAGNNVLSGDSGVDTADYSGSDSAVTLSLATNSAQATGGSGSDTLISIESLTGSAYNDRLVGNTDANLLSGGSGTDTLSGGDGNDTLDGGTSGDSMTGGAGNDSYVVENSADKVIEASGGGADRVSASISVTLSGYVEKLTLTGTAAINGTGNGSSNTITGNSAINSLSGGDGNDSLYGMEAADTLTGGNGNDLLDGGSSGDSLTGGAGNDRYVVQNSADKVVEASGGGFDSVSASINYTLPAEVEKLTLTGSSALAGHGNSLNNALVGNSGNNLLRGSTGNDTLTGGAGLDVFRFSSALNASTNADTVLDFALSDDVLQLENSIFTELSSTGVLLASNFRANSSGSASGINDHVLYETDTGKLFYDADGNGAGAKVLVATLSNLPALTSADIFVT
jgi:Ca2+-binding RTX toxin-like protein